MVIVKGDASLGDGVDGWRGDLGRAVEGNVVEAEIVGDDEDNWRRGGVRGAEGRGQLGPDGSREHRQHGRTTPLSRHRIFRLGSRRGFLPAASSPLLKKEKLRGFLHCSTPSPLSLLLFHSRFTAALFIVSMTSTSSGAACH
jgi:hypothetical protein